MSHSLTGPTGGGGRHHEACAPKERTQGREGIGDALAVRDAEAALDHPQSAPVWSRTLSLSMFHSSLESSLYILFYSLRGIQSGIAPLHLCNAGTSLRKEGRKEG
eukprot:1161222-Pelagomonas_calceolata.AAC.15